MSATGTPTQFSLPLPWDADELYALLPAIQRLRDHEQGEPLRQLLAVIAEQIAVVQENIEAGYDDLFIETCAEWVVPYIGDLVGARLLHNPVGVLRGAASARAQVANTLAYRRRKGTLAVLEQLARDVTNYPAVAVEFLQRLATSQHMNHLRPDHPVTIDIRDRRALEAVGGPFDRAQHTLEVRRIASGRGRYNVPNIGISLFRLRALPLRDVTAARVDDFRYTFNPLGIATPLFNLPETETSLTDFAGREHVPLPLSRLTLRGDFGRYYGVDASIALQIDGQAIAADRVTVCNLADFEQPAGTIVWAHAPTDQYGIDPVLGRLALPTTEPAPAPEQVRVTYHHGFSDALGGGGYERDVPEGNDRAQPVVPPQPSLQAGLTAIANGGTLEFQDSQTYDLAGGMPNLSLGQGAAAVLLAANGQRPLLRLTGGELVIDAGAGATIELNGLCVAGGTVRVTGTPAMVRLVDCTLVPGLSRTPENEPATPAAPSLVVEGDSASVSLERCIVGGLRIANGASATITRSIVDATSATEVAYAAPAGTQPGGLLDLRNSTIIGRVFAQQVGEIGNTIIVAVAPAGELPVRIARTQVGCVRYSYLPLTARAPRRFACQPTSQATAEEVEFTSVRFGTPGYCQLRGSCPAAIRHGADDESEMGVFHDLYQPQREINLRTRLDEYLRYGLQAGIFYAS